MADDFKESRNEIEEEVMMKEGKIQDGEQQQGGHSVQQQQQQQEEEDSYFLLEMNLLTVLLSSLCVPGGEDGLDSDEERRRKVAKSNDDKACLSRIQNKRRVTDETKFGRRPSQRVQPIKDFRHCRKM